MFNGNFLRRLEAVPSEDLARRRDLLYYQTEVGLDPSEWTNLVKPSSAAKELTFRTIHSSFIENYKKKIITLDSSFLFKSILLPAGCFNRTVYNLCLINRIRYEMGYPLVDTEEWDWPIWAICLNDPTMLDKLDNLIIFRFNNG